MRDRTAQTEPLTIGQQLVARWEGINSGWSEPADLAEAIDEAIDAEREACAKVIENAWFDARDSDWDQGVNDAKKALAVLVRHKTLGSSGE